MTGVKLKAREKSSLAAPVNPDWTARGFPALGTGAFRAGADGRYSIVNYRSKDMHHPGPHGQEGKQEDRQRKEQAAAWTAVVAPASPHHRIAEASSPSSTSPSTVWTTKFSPHMYLHCSLISYYEIWKRKVATCPLILVQILDFFMLRLLAFKNSFLVTTRYSF